MNENLEKKENFVIDRYKELHAASRNYDTKLWTIPGLFIIVVGYTLTQLDFKDFWNQWINALWLLGNAFVILSLALQANKDSFFQISLQKEINRLEKKYLSKNFPLYSATDREIRIRMDELKQEENGVTYFGAIRTWAILQRVSNYFFILVSLTLIASLVLGISILGNLLNIF